MRLAKEKSGNKEKESSPFIHPSVSINRSGAGPQQPTYQHRKDIPQTLHLKNSYLDKLE